jgi:hypothetical protein
VYESIPVVLGGAVILLLVLGLVVLLLRDFVRIALKIIALVVILGAVAMWFGWLDSSDAGEVMSSVGEWVMSMYNSVLGRVEGAAPGP